MRFSAAFLVVVAATSASALAVFGSPDGGSITPSESLKVPGESPLEFCNADHDDELLTIEKVDLAPNPPKP